MKAYERELEPEWKSEAVGKFNFRRELLTPKHVAVNH